MNEKSLEKNLANLERELLAVQTAHNIGLGVVRYWEYADTLVTGEYIVAFICANVKDGERLNPFIEFYTDSSKAAQATIIKSITYPERYALLAIALEPSGMEMDWKMVSTSQMEYHYVYTVEDAEEWLGEYYV